jgi:hypothetical protein
MIENSEQRLDAAILRALEQKPAVPVPAEFAARLALAAPAQRRLRQSVSAGKVAAIAALVLLATALFALAPHVAGKMDSFSYGLEMLLLVQLAAVAYGLLRMQNDGL